MAKRTYGKRGTVMPTFLALASRETNDCVLWPFAKTTGGYGTMTIDGRTVLVHREALRRRAPQPEGQRYTLHAPEVCHEPSCMNYRHLRWGSNRENSLDTVLDWTMSCGEARHNHVLTEAAVRVIRTSSETNAALARRYGVAKSAIWSVRAGRSWKHVL